MWTSRDAQRHTRKARSAKAKRAFAAAANSVLDKTGDEGRAVAAGNAAVNKSNAKSKRKRIRRGLQNPWSSQNKARNTKRKSYKR
jgi:hypothetical protein